MKLHRCWQITQRRLTVKMKKTSSEAKFDHDFKLNAMNYIIAMILVTLKLLIT